MPTSPVSREATPEVPPAQRCVYPECKAVRKPDKDLCAKFHSTAWSPNQRGGAQPDHNLIKNDGLVDWEAVCIAARGERIIQMTWIERDIAIMQILGAGGSYFEAALRVGMTVHGEHDPKLRGAKFRRLAARGRRVYGTIPISAA